MLGFLTELEINLIVAGVALLCGVIFSQKIKDWFKGIPAQARVALNSVESDTLTKIKAAQAEVLSQLPKPPAAKVAVAPAPVTPLVPVAVAAAPAAPAVAVAAEAPAAPAAAAAPVAAAPAA